MNTSASHASVDIEFEGPTAFLIHDVTSDGRLVRVMIDGKEYAPVDMMGAPQMEVSTCLACDLKPGRHKLSLQPLLPWKTGTMTIRSLEVTSGP
jgi:hypothetical protein